MAELMLAVAQFSSAIGAREENLASVGRLSERASAASARFVLFPEDCLTGYPSKPASAADVAITEDGPEAKRLGEIAHGYGITIAAGCIERRGERFHSSHLILHADGKREIIRKRSVDERDQTIGLVASEEENPDLTIGGVPAVLSICMDGTKEFFDAAAARGVKIILHPSGGACAVTARKNQPDASEIDAREVAGCMKCLDAAQQTARRLKVAYLVANPIGFDGERGYPGNSFIISPSGEVLAHLKPTAIIESMRESVGVAKVNV